MKKQELEAEVARLGGVVVALEQQVRWVRGSLHKAQAWLDDHEAALMRLFPAGDELYDPDGKVAAAKALLPAWFVGRMMDDVWYFGLMLTTGQTMGISNIRNVTKDKAGEIWIDAKMLDVDHGQYPIDILTAPCSERLDISINARHIVGAFEIAYT